MLPTEEFEETQDVTITDDLTPPYGIPKNTTESSN
jgi:hypothetical protein